MYSAVASAGFDALFNPWRRRRLRTAPFLRVPAGLPADRPLLMVANHTSWWDGFLLRDLHRQLRPGAPMYTIMTEAELRKQPVLRLLGATPLDPASPSSLLRMLRTVGGMVRARPDATVLLFPQGRIWPAWRRPLEFRRGIELLMRQLGSCYVLPAGIHLEALNNAAPTAFVALGAPLRYPEDQLTAPRLEAAVAECLDHIAAILAEHGEAATLKLEGAV
jgi:1-acyl-sn-glycerol-3-phosphate acyltransferase